MDIEVLKLPSWHGFALGFEVALKRVDTPYVMVLPHDMEFKTACDIRTMVQVLAEPTNDAQYIGFPNANNANHAERVMQKSGISLKPVSVHGLDLMPLLQWKENPHIASVEKYRSFVYKSWPPFKAGQYIEDTFGQRQKKEIAAEGFAAHSKYGTYLLWNSEGKTWTHHMDGRGYRALFTRDEQRRGPYDTQRVREAEEFRSLLLGDSQA